MPTYDYKCKACNHQFEAFQRMSDDPLQECPQSKGEVYRLISGGTGLIFKGSGFYITDYKDNKNSSDKSSTKTTTANSSTTQNSSEPKKDTKKSESKKKDDTSSKS